MKISIIGVGNIGGAIARGLLQAKAVAASDLSIADPNAAALTAFASQGVQTFTHGIDATREADLVIVAVKPWLMQEVLHKLKPSLKANTMVASVAASITLEQMQSELSGMPIFRIMPNTAIAFGQSMTFITSDNTSEEQEQSVVSLFQNLGKVMLISEGQMSAATALSSCGIAYAMRYVSANMHAGVEIGFTPDAAKEIILQTIQGAINLLQQTGEHPEKEIDKVTTPNGLTIKGLNTLDHEGFSSAIISAVKASM